MPDRLRDEHDAQLRRTEEAEACAVAAAAKALVRVWSHAIPRTSWGSSTKGRPCCEALTLELARPRLLAAYTITTAGMKHHC